MKTIFLSGILALACETYLAQTIAIEKDTEKAVMYQSKSIGKFQKISLETKTTEGQYDENIVYPTGGGKSIFIRNINKKEEKIESSLLIQDIEIKTFPNPASDEFNIIYHVPDNKKPIINIFNIVGTIIYSHYLPSEKSSFKIPLNNFDPGVYLFQIMSEGETIHSDKIMVIK